MYTITTNELYNLLIEHDLLKDTAIPSVNKNTVFRYLSYDSRDIQENTLFFCKGMNFKEALLADAVEKGVTHYVSEVSYNVTAEAILVKDIRETMAIVAQAFYRQPQNSLYKIGITGTKGKTTTAYFIKKIFDDAFDAKVALFSSEETTLDGTTFTASKLTTPEALDLYKQMATAVEAGVTHLVMEVSSQAYKTKRVHHLTFETGIFLNISPDHISPIEHATFEEYFTCKQQLLLNSKQMIINHESDHYAELQEICETHAIPYYTFGKAGSDYYIEEMDNPRQFQLTGHPDTLHVDGEYQLAQFGTFNHDNAAAAILTAGLAKISTASIQKSLPTSHVPGRMNLLEKANGAYFFVDYAHNYLSIKAMGDLARDLRPNGRVIIVTGSAGDKAQSRRPDIGRALAECADVAIITSDDPGFEEPEMIAKEILATLDNSAVEIHVELDRSKAVTLAFSMAQSEDTVILAGKGTEQMMKVHSKEIYYEGDFHITQRLIQENLL
ncbi:UDP-N-acetylmuramyl-tripeptide synthetase [Candidatus Enterococcus willemsii]|uniref:UDP-N-acetylmuramoylalanyl-D-glutamate--L-lysine ligase n=1 Tax=Candidatus Enterococcus willemsii TaxID=1857215 RepID=A0ABQ6Z0Q1_9ENTE|nr:UDP-N-acetylmuramyl-tripeptide synthetase [Enterococcus sp. CU12B]KAF1304593.1 UDP-N-acetylmuramoylalanyl-D-glutamate--L-lysine ligase [Enterococcus sp. CU12B]